MQPTLAELTARLLAKSPMTTACEPDVEPFEVASAFRAEPLTAWADATFAAKSLGLPSLPIPSNWATVVREFKPNGLSPMAIGHAPQCVSELSLLSGPNSTQVSNATARLTASGKANGGEKSLFAAAAARLAGEFDRADDILTALEADADATTTNVAKNERACLLWQTGRVAEAAAVWETLPAGPVRAFNMALVHLTNGDSLMASASLHGALKQLPESCGWYHLAQLYLLMSGYAA